MLTTDKQKLIDDQVQLLANWNADYLKFGKSNIETAEQVRRNIETIGHLLRDN